MCFTYSETNLVILKLGVQLGQEHCETANILVGGFNAADDLVLLSRASLEQTRPEGGLLRGCDGVIHRAQARAIVAEIRFADRLF